MWEEFWDLPFMEIFGVLKRFQRDGKGTHEVESTAQKDGQLVARRSFLWFEKRFSENEVPAGDQQCLQHCTKQQCELDLECSQRTYGTSLQCFCA